MTRKMATAMLTAGCFLFSPAAHLQASGEVAVQTESGVAFLQMAAVTKAKPKRTGKG